MKSATLIAGRETKIYCSEVYRALPVRPSGNHMLELMCRVGR